MLWQKMTVADETPRELASHLKISYVYLMALARGVRPIEKADRAVYVTAAKYLQLPVAQIYLLAGALSAEDFVLKEQLTSKINNTIEQMRIDPKWCGYVPPKAAFSKTPESVKTLLCLVYEDASKQSVMSSVLVEQAS